MQTRQKPPITINPDAIPLLKKKHMPEIRDMVINQMIRVAEERDVHIDYILVRPDYALEYTGDWERVIFAVYVSADEDTAMSYMEAIGKAIMEAEKSLSEEALYMLNYHVGESVEW